MEVVFRRHAQTAGNLLGQYIGVTDQPLCPEGLAQAERAGADRAVGRVAVTPLSRTRQTARILYPNAEQIVCPAFGEMDFGRFEGKSYRELDGDPEYTRWVESGCRAACPGGENMAGFCRRVRAGFLALADRAVSEQWDRLVLVVHGGTIMAALSGFAQPLRPYFDWRVPCCGGYRAALDPASWSQRPALTHVEPYREVRL